jgi:hypothetical protein
LGTIDHTLCGRESFGVSLQSGRCRSPLLHAETSLARGFIVFCAHGVKTLETNVSREYT